MSSWWDTDWLTWMLAKRYGITPEEYKRAVEQRKKLADEGIVCGYTHPFISTPKCRTCGIEIPDDGIAWCGAECKREYDMWLQHGVKPKRDRK